jgi:hypothetical protein
LQSVVAVPAAVQMHQVPADLIALSLERLSQKVAVQAAVITQRGQQAADPEEVQVAVIQVRSALEPMELQVKEVKVEISPRREQMVDMVQVVVEPVAQVEIQFHQQV